jgi:hypothetical protein
MTRVVLPAAHLDSDPTNNRAKNLRALCQRCHMLHDRRPLSGVILSASAISA